MQWCSYLELLLQKWCSVLVNAMLILTADSQTGLIKSMILWSINIALKLHVHMSCALGILFLLYRRKVCLPFYLFSFKPLFRRAAESSHRLKNAVDRWGLCSIRLDLSFWVVLEADCTPCYVSDAFLGVSWEAVTVSRGHCPLYPHCPWDSWPGHTVGTVNKHGVAWCEMVPPGHLS